MQEALAQLRVRVDDMHWTSDLAERCCETTEFVPLPVALFVAQLVRHMDRYPLQKLS